MLVSKIQSEHREELDKQEEEFNEQQERMFNNEKRLKEIADDLQKENDRLKKELEDREGAYVKLTEDMAFLTKNHEEEVQLRLQFESKLNSLHALHRDVKAKYTRSTEDIYSLETFNKEKQELIEKQKEELIALRTNKIENESLINVQKEKIKTLVQELDFKKTQIAEFEVKITKQNQIIHDKDTRIKDADQVQNTQKLKIEAHLATIKGLEGEKQHLELSLNENRTMKDKYYERSEIKQREYQELLEKHNLVQKDVVAINEIKRDRDERIQSFRDELDELQSKYDELSKANASLVVRHEHLTEKATKLETDYFDCSDKLTQSNKMRQEKEEALDKKTKDYNLLSKQYEEALQTVERLKKDNEKTHSRLLEESAKHDQIKLTKESIEKQNEIQRT